MTTAAAAQPAVEVGQPQDLEPLEQLALRYQQTRDNRDFDTIAQRCRGLVHFMVNKVVRAFFGTARRMLEELQAAAWLAFWHATQRYRGDAGSRFSTYACACMYWALHGLVTRRINEPDAASLDSSRDEDGSTLLDVLVDAKAKEPGAEPSRADLAARLQDLIDRHCKPREAECIRLHYLEGWTLKAIGHHIGVSSARVGQIIGDGFQRLRPAIADAETLQAPEPPADPLTLEWGPSLQRIISMCQRVHGGLPATFREWLQDQAERKAAGLDVLDVPPLDVLSVVALERQDRDRQYMQHVAAFMPGGRNHRTASHGGKARQPAKSEDAACSTQ